MSLDLFNRNIDEGVAYAASHSAPDLPVDFSGGLSESWNKGFLTGQSISGGNRILRAQSDLVDDIIAKTGDTSLSAFVAAEGGGFDVAALNERIARHKTTRPDLDIEPISDDAIQRRADEIGRRALEESTSSNNRESTAGGSVGRFLGSAGAALTDPVNLVAFPLAAPEALGIMGTAMAWAAIGGVSQAGIEVLNASSMERIQPGYSESGEPVQNILAAAGTAGVLGGGLKSIANAWTRYRTGSWPRSVRDAGNVIDSEVQIANSNVLPGIEGEAVHRAALAKAVDDIARGRPVDVDSIVPRETFATYTSKIDEVITLRDDLLAADRTAVEARANATGGRVQSELPFEAAALDQRTALFRDSLADAVQGISRDITRDDATLIAARIERMPTDQARAVLSEAVLRPATLAGSVGGKLPVAAPRQLPAGAQVTGDGVHGPVLEGVEGRYADAVSWLRETKGGDAKGVLAHPNVPGRIDIVWGDGTGGLAHIIDKHPEVVPIIPDVLPGMQVVSATANRIQLSDGRYTAAIRLDHDGIEKTWLLTAFEGKARRGEGRTGSLVDSQEAAQSPLPPGKGNIGQNEALAKEVTPARIEELRSEPDMAETVLRDLDKLRADSPDLEVPTGVTVDAEGRTVATTRKVEDILDEAESRELAAKEIMDCVGPYPKEGVV